MNFAMNKLDETHQNICKIHPNNKRRPFPLRIKIAMTTIDDQLIADTVAQYKNYKQFRSHKIRVATTTPLLLSLLSFIF